MKRSLKHWFNIEDYKQDARVEALVLSRWETPTKLDTPALPDDLNQTVNIMPMDVDRANPKYKIIPEELLDRSRQNPVVVLLAFGFFVSGLFSAIAGNFGGVALATLLLLPIGWTVGALSSYLIREMGGELHIIDHARWFLKLQRFLVFGQLAKLLALGFFVSTGDLATPDQFLMAFFGANVAIYLVALFFFHDGREVHDKNDDGLNKATVEKRRWRWHSNILRRVAFGAVLVSPVLAKCVIALGLALVPKILSHEFFVKRGLRLTQSYYRED